MAGHGEVLGVPYDFRLPTWRKLKRHYWNPADERLFVPRAFGIGWDVNLYTFRERYPGLFYAALIATVMSVMLKLIRRERR